MPRKKSLRTMMAEEQGPLDAEDRPICWCGRFIIEVVTQDEHGFLWKYKICQGRYHHQPGSSEQHCFASDPIPYEDTILTEQLPGYDTPPNGWDIKHKPRKPYTRKQKIMANGNDEQEVLLDIIATLLTEKMQTIKK